VNDPIRVLLVDDDALVRAGLMMMLAGAPQVEVAGEAEDGRGVLPAIARHRPDVVLMDIRMPYLDGIAATRLVRSQPRPPQVIVLTTFDADDRVHRAVGAGADGYLVKDTPPADIVSAIRSVAAGHGVLSPAVTRPLLELVQRAAAQPTGPGNGDQADRRLSALTDREREVAIAIAHGTSNAEIGAQLYLSTATVKATVSRILTKLGLANRTQIAVVVRNSADPR
jgi:DNA-binding NarL/FixJ family response regulator